MSVIDLRQFGKRFKIEFDPAYDPTHRPADRLDPWMMVIPCERGTIYPQGDDRLAAEVEGRAPTRRKLQGLKGVAVIQDGDDFLAVTFNVTDFGKIAQILKPRRKRVLTAEQRERLATASLANRFPARPTRCTTRVDAPEINWDPTARPKGLADAAGRRRTEK
jgi:hypothetical protein